MKLSLPSLLLALFVFAGCSDSDSNKSMDTALPQDEVHTIQPEDIPAYLDRFNSQRSQIVFELDGQAHKLTFIEPDEDLKALFTSYPGGLLQIGFDVAREEPLPNLTVYEGDIELLGSDAFFENLSRILVGKNITVDEDQAENLAYAGRLHDQSNQEEFDVRVVVNESLITGGTSTLEADGNMARLSGDLGTSTYLQMQELLDIQPQINTLILEDISGSVNDAINMHTGRLIRDAGLNTHVEDEGDVNSGGVDLFAAGVERTVEEGAILGVHSWCCEDNVTADKLPREHPAHRAQLTYFREMLGKAGEDFYFFTLNAAPFKGIHHMTREEMIRYKLITDC